MTTPTISLNPLKKAAKSLELATINPPNNDIERDGAIQRFEYTFELSWKTLKRYFEQNSNPTNLNLKDLFREAGKQQLIDSVEQWFEYLEARNLTSHTYNLESAEKAYAAAVKFHTDVKKLIERLEKIIG